MAQNSKKPVLSILDYLDPNQIVFLHVTSRDEAINLLIDALDREGKLKSKQQFYSAIMKREKIVSTGIGMGVAVPHAKLEGYEDFFLAIGIQKELGIEWDAIDGAPVRLIFLIGGPDQKQNEYLIILSELTSLIKNDEIRKKMLQAKDPSEVIQLITKLDILRN